MNKIPLQKIDVDALDVFTNTLNVRKDLHVFTSYVAQREVKRSYRQNTLPKADLRRLAALLSNPDEAETLKQYNEAPWVDFIDDLAFQLDFVHYDIEGVYMGYSSQSPSFPDNYIRFQEKTYRNFLALPSAEQERRLLNLMINDPDAGRSEFYTRGAVGRLDSFTRWGIATGVIPTLNFPKARRFLLDILTRCQAGVWYSTASLVQYLKANHPFFLIPQHPKSRGSRWRDPEPVSRYGNFYESRKSSWDREIKINDTDPDAFERVEGRYVERFLESAPLLLQYVDVAYADPPETLYPSLNRLRAFRVNAGFLQLMRGELPPPKVTVLPNFEVHVEAAFYPVNVLNKLEPLSDPVQDDRITILKLNRKKITAHAAKNDDTDIPALLKDLSGRELPQNVQRELAEWAGRSDAFTLYQGFGLFEGDAASPVVAQQTIAEITPTLKIIRSPASLFSKLEEDEQIPLLITHSPERLKPAPKKARSLFPTRSTLKAARKKEKKPELLLQRETAITLHFPSKKSLEAYRRAMIKARCPVTVNQDALTLTWSKRHQSLAAEALKTIRQSYRVKIKDMA